MKYKIFFFTVLMFLTLSVGFCEAKYSYGPSTELEVTVKADSTQIDWGSDVVFTITLRNKTNHTVKLKYDTAQEWDMVVIHRKRQFYRWSSDKIWSDMGFVQALKAGESKSIKLNWSSKTNDHFLSQGSYSVRAVACLSPTRLVSEDFHFDIVPPSYSEKETIKVHPKQIFEIKVPAYNNKGEYLIWNIHYKHNNRRLSLLQTSQQGKEFKLRFRPNRLGHVEFDLYACPESVKTNKTTEKRSYRIEITNLD